MKRTMSGMRNILLIGLIIGLLPGTLSTAAAGGRREQAAVGDLERPYKITTTVGMLTDAARHIAGDRAVVNGIIGEGVDPHLYKPTRSDVQQLLSADVIFYVGLLLEGKMSDVLDRVAEQGRPVHAVGELLDRRLLLRPDGSSSHADPHIWMDAALWGQAVDRMTDQLVVFDAQNGDYYRTNAEKYLAEIGRLDRYVRSIVASIPKRRRVLVTAHDAFGYFGRAYDIEVHGIQGLSTESEAGLNDITRLVGLLTERNIGAIFVESSVADKNIRALIEGARARDHHVEIGGTLFSDAMGPAGGYTGTYIGMIDHNATTITRALEGMAQVGGMNARLVREDR